MISTTSSSSTSNLLSHPQLWRAGELNRFANSATKNGRNGENSRNSIRNGISSGYAKLDAQLPGGGWPRAGLAEVLHAQPGLGELRLLAPALADLSEEQDRWIAWINPPAIPYAPALGRFGIRTDRLLMIHPKNHADALWAAEQAARSGTCSAVLIWLDENRLKHAETRRLQVAAKQGNSLACLFRSTQAARHASAAELRLHLHNPLNTGNAGTQPAKPESVEPQSFNSQKATGSSYSNMQVDVLKRRGGWAVDNIGINLVGDNPIQRLQDIQQQLSMWRNLQQQPLRATPQASPHRTSARTSSAQGPSAQGSSAQGSSSKTASVVQQLH